MPILRRYCPCSMSADAQVRACLGIACTAFISAQPDNRRGKCQMMSQPQDEFDVEVTT